MESVVSTLPVAAVIRPQTVVILDTIALGVLDSTTANAPSESSQRFRASAVQWRSEWRLYASEKMLS